MTEKEKRSAQDREIDVEEESKSQRKEGKERGEMKMDCESEINKHTRYSSTAFTHPSLSKISNLRIEQNITNFLFVFCSTCFVFLFFYLIFLSLLHIPFLVLCNLASNNLILIQLSIAMKY